MTLKDEDTMIDYTFHALRLRLVKHVRKAELHSADVLTYRRYAGLLIASAPADAFIERVCQLISRDAYYASGSLGRR